MANLEVLKFPNSVLRRKCEPVDEINEHIIAIAKNMADTMYAFRGIGLAAPQVAIPKQLIVLDIGDGLITIINPEITIIEGESKMEEGCLCLPKLTVEVERNENVQVKGVDLKGKPVSFDADDLLARVFQHEIDHLHGVLIIDKLSKIKRDLAIKEYKKLNINKKEKV
jgi:peptide deformylase